MSTRQPLSSQMGGFVLGPRTGLQAGPASGRWVRVAPFDSLPMREGRLVVVGDLEIALFRISDGSGDRVLALESRCPHRGGPLNDGIVTGLAVVCPLHAWKVGLQTGTVERPAGTAACIQTYATRVDRGVVLLKVPPEPASPGERIA